MKPTRGHAARASSASAIQTRADAAPRRAKRRLHVRGNGSRVAPLGLDASVPRANSWPPLVSTNGPPRSSETYAFFVSSPSYSPLVAVPTNSSPSSSTRSSFERGREMKLLGSAGLAIGTRAELGDVARVEVSGPVFAAHQGLGARTTPGLGFALGAGVDVGFFAAFAFFATGAGFFAALVGESSSGRGLPRAPSSQARACGPASSPPPSSPRRDARPSSPRQWAAGSSSPSSPPWPAWPSSSSPWARRIRQAHPRGARIFCAPPRPGPEGPSTRRGRRGGGRGRRSRGDRMRRWRTLGPVISVAPSAVTTTPVSTEATARASGGLTGFPTGRARRRARTRGGHRARAGTPRGRTSWAPPP